jgi:hypothetical protein
MKKKTESCLEEEDDLTPVINDCTKFYRCGSGKRFIFACPPGTAFDTSSQICNYIRFVPECKSPNYPFGGGNNI